MVREVVSGPVTSLRLHTRLLRLVTLGGETLLDVNLSVPQQPHHTAHQLHERVGLLQDLVLGQIPGSTTTPGVTFLW